MTRLHWRLGGLVIPLVAVAVVLWVRSTGCNRETPVWATSIPEIGEANLSHDGTIIALAGFAFEGGPDDLTREVGFLDAQTGRLLARSPAGLDDFSLPDWGRDASYVTRAETGQITALYWAPTAGEAAREVPLSATWLQRFCLDWQQQHVVLSDIRAARSITDVQDMEVLTVRLDAKRPPRSLLRAPGFISLVGVVPDPADGDGSLAVVAGEYETGQGVFPSMLGLSVASGQLRWRAPIGSRSGWFRAVVPTGDDKALVCVEREAPEEKPPMRTEVLHLNTANGDMHLVTTVPDACRFATPLRAKGNEVRVYFGGVSGLWEFDPAARRKPPVKLMESTVTTHPLGARKNALSQVELLYYGENAVWRYNLSTRELELLLGNPGSPEERPKVL